MKFTNRDGEIRFYDGTATPYYLKIVFSGGDLSAPLGPPRPEEELLLDRQTMDSNACYVRGSDASLLAPLEISLSVTVTSHATFGYLLDWLEGNTVNGQTIVTTKGTTQRDGATNNPAFADSAKKCLNLEYQLDGPSSDIVWKYAEVYLPLSEAVMTETEDGVQVALKGQVYGTITRSSSFTSGTDVTS
ncbi:MAG: hypothetical protein JRJ59_08910 [Deltaproteobacteria bacterium]|nr:hypothetical protein [Deltaproteobacteria bacterium]